MALDGQGINTGPLRYSFTKRFLTGYRKATFNQAALDIDKQIIQHVFTKYVY